MAAVDTDLGSGKPEQLTSSSTRLKLVSIQETGGGSPAKGERERPQFVGALSFREEHRPVPLDPSVIEMTVELGSDNAHHTFPENGLGTPDFSLAD